MDAGPLVGKSITCEGASRPAGVGGRSWVEAPEKPLGSWRHAACSAPLRIKVATVGDDMQGFARFGTGMWDRMLKRWSPCPACGIGLIGWTRCPPGGPVETPGRGLDQFRLRGIGLGSARRWGKGAARLDDGWPSACGGSQRPRPYAECCRRHHRLCEVGGGPPRAKPRLRRRARRSRLVCEVDSVGLRIETLVALW